jgi:hypothetical protein
MTTEVFLLKKEVRSLNEQLYNEYKKVKNLTEQVKKHYIRED